MNLENRVADLEREVAELKVVISTQPDVVIKYIADSLRSGVSEFIPSDGSGKSYKKSDGLGTPNNKEQMCDIQWNLPHGIVIVLTTDQKRFDNAIKNGATIMLDSQHNG